VRVGVISFDDRIQYYTIRGGTPRMMVVPDIKVGPLPPPIPSLTAV